MPQSLILLKTLPDPNYLHDLQSEGILRASMNFLPGGCWSGAALFDASPSYLGDPGASTTEGTVDDASPDTATRADSTCPNPEDLLGCKLWEIREALRKLSFNRPLDFNAFAFLAVEPGTATEQIELLVQLGGADDGTNSYVVGELGREYLAAAHLIGCGAYNLCVEVLADSHDRVLEVLHRVTDARGVKEYAVGRLAARGARGFGKPESLPTTA